MTTAQTDTPDLVDEDDDTGPLLDLDELTKKRDYVVSKDKRYFLRTDGLSPVNHHRFLHLAAADARLLQIEPKDLTGPQQKEMAQTLDELIEIVLDAPASVRKLIQGDKARGLVRHFQHESQPGAASSEGLMALVGALLAGQAMTPQTETETPESEPESLTGESSQPD